MTAEVIHARDSFADSSAQFIRKSAQTALRNQDYFVLSLCGGNTPKWVFDRLAKVYDLDWARTIITFGDERCVGPEDPDSNYGMARQYLLDRVEIPEDNVLRMRGELPPDEAARDYEARLREKMAELGDHATDDMPVIHDLILLGIGNDGHTASLFPGSAALEARDRLVVENYVEKMDAWRITFTYPLINAARAAVFLIGGEDKKEVVDEVLSGESDYPSARVSPERLFFLLGY
jgi:6-phosphogluconolactonase